MFDYKNCVFELKDFDEKKRQVQFYVSTFGTVDSHNEFTTKNTFKDFNLKRVKHFLDHDQTKLIGAISSIEVDSKGVLVSSKLSKTTLANDVYEHYLNGAITEHSTGCLASKTVREKQSDGTYELKNAELWEVSSLQAWGSNHNTPVVSVKSLEIEDKFNALKQEVEELKKLVGKPKIFTISDLVNTIKL